MNSKTISDELKRKAIDEKRQRDIDKLNNPDKYDYPSYLMGILNKQKKKKWNID